MDPEVPQRILRDESARPGEITVTLKVPYFEEIHSVEFKLQPTDSDSVQTWPRKVYGVLQVLQEEGMR